MNRIEKMALAGVLLLTAVVYAPYIGLFFKGDDFTNLAIANENGYRLVSLFKPTAEHLVPVFRLFTWLEWVCFGPRAAGYHASNLVVHLLNTLLVFAIARRLFPHPVLPAVAAILFGISATHGITAMWMSTSMVTLAALFMLLTILFFLKALDGRPALWLSLAVACNLLNMLSFTTGLQVPFICFLLIPLVFRRMIRWRDLGYVAPFAVSLALFFILRAAFDVQSLPEGEERGLLAFVLSRVPSGFVTMIRGTYVGFIPFFTGAEVFKLFPEGLHALHKYFSATVILLVLLRVDWKSHESRWLLAVGGVLLLLFVSLYILPALGRDNASPDMFARRPRYRYIPCAALALSAGAVLAAIPRRRLVLFAGAGLLVLVVNLIWIGRYYKTTRDDSVNNRAFCIAFCEGLDKVAQAHERSIVVNAKLRMRKLDGTLAGGWHTRPRLLAIVCGGEYGHIRFIPEGIVDGSLTNPVYYVESGTGEFYPWDPVRFAIPPWEAD